jgi:hypothetical protein
MARFCPNCGTEVEDTAVFCPTCGQPIDQAAETEIPPAPAWPDQPEREPMRPVEPASVESAVEDAWQARHEDPTRVAEPPPDIAPPPTPLPPRPVERSAPAAPPISVPFTMPVTLSAWLIGGGVTLAALGIIIGLFGLLRPVDLVLLIALVGIAATVFFSSSVPHIPQLRLVTFVIVLLGFGMAIDRLTFGGAGAGELLFFLGAAAAAIGAILLELGRDQPLGGPG